MFRMQSKENISRLWTIGHSTRNIDDFISLLEENGIKLLADVRSLPGSKCHPQFNKEALAESLSAQGIRYADHMETEEFRKGVERLLALTREAGPTAIMCAEALWWRCHRSLISDYLKSRGIAVMHILDANKTEPHPFTSAARIVNGRLSYERESLL